LLRGLLRLVNGRGGAILPGKMGYDFGDMMTAVFGIIATLAKDRKVSRRPPKISAILYLTNPSHNL